MEVLVRRATARCTLNSFWIVACLSAASCAFGQSQAIDSIYAEFTLPGSWQGAKQYSGESSSDVYYDAQTGSLLLIGEQGELKQASEIAKYFGGANGPTAEAAGVMSAWAFPLPAGYREKASKDLAKGDKPPKMWDMKEGDGNPLWFYVSQLFDGYRTKSKGGASEISEEFVPVRVTKAEQLRVSGGDALLFEVETERPCSEAALKRFRMPGVFKDQRVRYGWIQFAPGGIAAGQALLSVAFATTVDSNLKVEEVAKQVSAGKIKPL